jgi:peptidoglycan/LPS O-acetylase OafA/YrhL
VASLQPAADANNFDLIRLAAALQVAVTHTTYLFGITGWQWPLHVITNLFPGVPVFFFISGFLISHSFERNSALRNYARNRLLRIYPALVVCLVLSISSVWASGYLKHVSVPFSQWAKWIAALLSVAWLYNPSFMHGYGTGSLNASIWTISVEIQFYFLVPMTYAALRLRRLQPAQGNRALLALIGLFLLAHVVCIHLMDRSTSLFPYLNMSCVPWFYMFLTGQLAQRNLPRLRRALAGRFLPLFLGYCALGLPAARVLGWRFDNDLNPLLFLALATVTLAAAFSAPTLSDNLLRRQDLSYGVYLYHAPTINFLLATGVLVGARGALATMGATFALALGSWWLVERPALRLKRRAAYSHDPVMSLSHPA